MEIKTTMCRYEDLKEGIIGYQCEVTFFNEKGEERKFIGRSHRQPDALLTALNALMTELQYNNDLALDLCRRMLVTNDRLL